MSLQMEIADMMMALPFLDLSLMRRLLLPVVVDLNDVAKVFC